jgi:hypothetical protein
MSIAPVIRDAKIHGTKYRLWFAALLARRPTKVAAIALANKLARMAWAMMSTGARYNYPVLLPWLHFAARYEFRQFGHLSPEIPRFPPPQRPSMDGIIAEGHCTRSRLIKTPDWISERPPCEAVFLYLLLAGDELITHRTKASTSRPQQMLAASAMKSTRRESIGIAAASKNLANSLRGCLAALT